MRKITRDAVAAFYSGRHFKRGNTEVTTSGDSASLSLHGNLIAISWHSGAIINDGGWQTPTTKERLNGVIGPGRICQKDWQWYLDDRPWDGSSTHVMV